MFGKALNTLRWLGIGFLAATLVFVMAGWIGSSIPRNSDWQEPLPAQSRHVEVLIGSNGIHTEIAMPLVTPEMDWRASFPASDIIAAERPYTHVAVSWGERDFFLETPTWADVNPLTVIGAMLGGDAVLHVAHYVRPASSPDYRPLRLRPEEYRALVSAILDHLPPHDERVLYAGYGAHDVFYSARGTYHIGNTCNQWTSDQLAHAGAITGWWTPFPGGVMKWVPELPGF